MLTFDIPFDKNISIQQAILLSKLTNQKFRKKLTGNILMALLMFLCGVLGGLSDGKFLNPLSILGAVFLTLIIMLLLLIKTNKKSYITKVNKQLVDEFEYRKLTTYIITEDSIAYSNLLHKVEITWVGIKGYTIFRDNIFIMFSNIVDQALIIGKTEISEDNYNALVEMLRDKSQYLEY